ncbi:hypothetical protein [Nocardia cyriacigeorgica]|uniref:hypothetical protein n=1 Tax=Nocardia cyriacigeorgica TaxID=135487 RepID=UPI00245563F9|nr:hypothetical protein [Nocardia cyriacigeorgica]
MFDHSPSSGLAIGSWISVGEHCSVRLAPLLDDDHLAFVFESGGSEFELTLAPGVLRTMIDLADEAVSAAVSAPGHPDAQQAAGNPPLVGSTLELLGPSSAAQATHPGRVADTYCNSRWIS